MGFYVIVPDERSRGVTMRNIVHQTAFIPANEISCTLQLKPLPNGEPYIVMPATFGPNMKVPFTLGVTADASVGLNVFDKEQLPPPSPN